MKKNKQTVQDVAKHALLLYFTIINIYLLTEAGSSSRMTMSRTQHCVATKVAKQHAHTRLLGGVHGLRLVAWTRGLREVAEEAGHIKQKRNKTNGGGTEDELI